MLSAASTTRDVSQAGERHQSVPHRRSRLGLSFLVCKTGRVLTLLSRKDSYIALHCSLGKGQKSFLPSESPRGAAGPLFNKRPPQICQGQPCQEKCLLQAGRPLRSRSCFDVLGAPKRGSSSIIHWKHLVEGSGSSRGLLSPPCPTARQQPDNPAGCKEGPEAAKRGTRPRPMSDTRPEEAELISEVCSKLWDARVQRVPHHSGVPTTLGSPQATPSPSPPHPMLPTLPGFPTRVSTVSDSPPRGPLRPRSPRSWGPSSWVPPYPRSPKPRSRCVRRGAHGARTLTASWGALGADAGGREGHQATRLQPWAAGVMARPALPAAALASAPARHLEGGAARAAPPRSPPRAQPQPLPPRLPARLPHRSRTASTGQSLGICRLSPVLWKEKGRPAPPPVQRRRGNAPGSSLQLGGSGGIVTPGLPRCWVLAF